MEKAITLRAKVYITLQTSLYTFSVLFQVWIVLPIRLWNIIHVLIVAVLAMVTFPRLDRVMPHPIEAVAELPSLQRRFCDLFWFDVSAVIVPAATASQVIYIFTIIPIMIGHGKRTS